MHWTDRIPPRLLDLILSLLLVACVIAPFARIARHEFVPFDDDIEITGNPRIQGLGVENLRWMFTDTRTTQRYTPLSWVAWALLYKGWGLNPAAFHLEALLVHALNAVLVFWVVRTVLRRTLPDRGPRLVSMASALGAALWALHPMRVEVVSWVTQVRFAEAAAFALVSVLYYFRSVDAAGDSTAGGHPKSRGRRAYFWGAVLAYIVSVLFYPSAIGLPLIFLAADIFPLRSISLQGPPGPPGAGSGGGGKFPWPGLRHSLLSKWPFWTAAMAAGLMTILGRFSQSAVFHGPASLEQFGLLSRIMQALYIFAYYLWKPFDPSHVAPVYTALVSFDPLAAPFWLSAALVVGLSIAAIAWRRRLPALAVLWIAHLALLFPVGGYFEHPHYSSDRYSYLQGVLLAIVVAALLLWVWPRAETLVRAAFIGALMLVLAAFASLDSAQAAVWRNGETLFRFLIADLGQDPYVADIHWRLGNVYLQQGRIADAIPEFDKTLAIDPTNARALRLKGASLLQVAKQAREANADAVRTLFLQAAADLDESARLRPQPDTFYFAAEAHARAGQYGAAERQLREALSLDPGATPVRLQLARLYYELGRTREAFGLLEQVLQSSPELAPYRASILRQWDSPEDRWVIPASSVPASAP